MKVNRRLPLLTIERALFTVACICLGWYAFVSLEATAYRMWADSAIDRMVADTAGSGPAQRKGPPQLPGEGKKNQAPARAAAGSLLGRIEIPRLGITAPLREGIDDRTLRLAAGHIPDTVLPGRDGNAGIAAHRDSFFRPLQYVQKDDEIRLTMRGGVVRYLVETTRIVRPEDVWVLNERGTPALTLVTCYPFHYIGNAPLRFIVWAQRVDADLPAH